MKKTGRILTLLLAICFMVTIFAACGGAKTAANSEATTQAVETTSAETQAATQAEPAKKLKIGIIYLTAEHPYYQAHAKQTQEYAKEKGFDLVELDGKLDQANMASQMENLIAQKVDGIIYCLLEAKAASADINVAQQAGVPVVTFAIKHDPESAKAPFVGIPEAVGGAKGGEEAAKLFQKNFPGKAPELFLVDMVGVKPVNDRIDGFVSGFKKLYPDVKIAGRVDGKGTKDAAMTQTEDFLQKNSTANVFYGGNGDMSLGALAALEARGRGTPKTEIVVSHDGSEPEVLKLADPNSALKLCVTNKPKELARAAVDTLLEIIDKKREMTSTDDVMVDAALLTADNLDEVQVFIKDEYFSKLELKK